MENTISWKISQNKDKEAMIDRQKQTSITVKIQKNYN